jgi:hypothetical protein
MPPACSAHALLRPIKAVSATLRYRRRMTPAVDKARHIFREDSQKYGVILIAPPV